MAQSQGSQAIITMRQLNSMIDKAVKAGLQAGQLHNEQRVGDLFQATEKRLYALPALREKVENDKDRLIRLTNGNAPERSKSILRLSRAGYRATPEEMLAALIRETEITIATDEHEIEMIEAALKSIESDPYYCVIKDRYIQGVINDDEIAAKIPCEKTTVYRQRKRLINRIAVALYGAAAL